MVNGALYCTSIYVYMYTLCLCVSLIADKYFPFICDVVIKLLLAQDNYQSSLTTASNLLSLSDKWKSRCKICSMCMLCTLYKHVCMHSVPERLVCVCVCVCFLGDGAHCISLY